MASTPRRRRLVERIVQLAQEELGEAVAGKSLNEVALAWALSQIEAGATFPQLTRMLTFETDWNGPGSGMWAPSRQFVSSTVLRLAPDARARVREARRVGATAIAEQALEIVDDASTVSTAHVQKARLQSDTRLALAAAFDPESFSTRAQPVVQLTHFGDIHISAMNRAPLLGLPASQRHQIEPLPVEVIPTNEDIPAALPAVSAAPAATE